jgi:hypothetical protein
MASITTAVTVSVDTHADAHVGAAFDSERGRPVGHFRTATTPAGYRQLTWARSLGDDLQFGLEGTSSYGVGLAAPSLRARPGVGSEVARALLVACAQRRGRPCPINDSSIATCCMT